MADVPEPLLAAAQACFADVGVNATSLTDVAERAGVSRATAYRAFGSKPGLVTAVVAEEVRRFFLRLAEVREQAEATAEGPREALTAILTFILADLRDHEIVQRVLRSEPEALVGLLVERRGDPTLVSLLVGAAEMIIAASPWASDLRVPPAQAAEMAVRTVFSLLLIPTTTLDPPEALVDLLLSGVLTPE